MRKRGIVAGIIGMALAASTQAAAIHYWKFDSSPGLLNDSVGSLPLVQGGTSGSAWALSGLNSGSPVPNPQSPALATNTNSAYFQGTDTATKWMKASHNLDFSLNNKTWTMEGWFNHQNTSTPAGAGDYIVGTRDGVGGWWLMMDSALKPSLYFNDAGGRTFATTAANMTALNRSEWYHFAVTWDYAAGANAKGQAKLFINGSLVATLDAPSAWNSLNADGNDVDGLLIGSRSAATNNTWDGRFDEFRLSNVVLSPNQFLVPEPATLGLLALGGLLLGRRGR